MNRSLPPRAVMCALVTCVMTFLCTGTGAAEEGFDLRDLNLEEFAYPAGRKAEEKKEKYDAKLLVYSHDPADQVVEFYKKKGMESDAVHPDPDRVVLEKMVAPHVPLRAVISSKPNRNKLSDNVLYRNLEVAATLGKHDPGELDQVRQKFDRLKERFYADNPRSILKECRQSGSAGVAQNGMSVEEQGRRLQELAMQGRMDELREATEALSAKGRGVATGGTTDQWDAEVRCLEELEKKSYPVEIEVTATRDDVLG